MLNLPVRVLLIHWVITLCAIGQHVCCRTVPGPELGLSLPSVIAALFIAAMSALTGGLLCFFRDPYDYAQAKLRGK